MEKNQGPAVNASCRVSLLASGLPPNNHMAEVIRQMDTVETGYPDDDQTKWHDHATRMIIAGIVSDVCDNPMQIIQAANRVMGMLKRRGYVPQIKTFNPAIDDNIY